MTRGTKRFLLGKTLEMLLTLLVVTVLSFLLVRLSPVDPAEAYARRSFAAFSYDEADMAALRARMGLDQPLIIQYGTWVMDALHLDFGESFVSGQPVFEKVTTAIGITVRIVLLSGVLQAVGILALGPLLYVARGRFSGRLLHFLCIAGVSIPSFFFASSYLDLFAVKFGLTSVAGYLHRHWLHCPLFADAGWAAEAGNGAGRCVLRAGAWAFRAHHPVSLCTARCGGGNFAKFLPDAGAVYGGLGDRRAGVLVAGAGLSHHRQRALSRFAGDPRNNPFSRFFAGDF